MQRRLRAADAWRIVAAVANAGTYLRRQGIEIACSMYAAKPYGLEEENECRRGDEDISRRRADGSGGSSILVK